MNLQERLMADLKEAMRSSDVLRRDTIRMVRSAIKYAEIDKQREASDEEAQAVIAREIKKRQEAIALLRQGGRAEAADQEQAEIEILKQYLPAQLSREQVVEVVQRIVQEMGASGLGQLGAVMRQAMSELKGKADGRLVNEVVREILSR